ncbi:MAG: winged helix-turn-helix transcriptional regulator [Microbacterium gubbeenense]|uniref:winged helix-turn-helix transcriptional regulator n=1 Tax=Microbacterium gubbeenense TaxID=159896 RepID=UPI000417413F|nr:response regulator transcription factor [Microbacterium gubbeenense]
MAHLLVLSPSPETDPPLAALGLLSHRVTLVPASASQLIGAPDADVTIVDARGDLAAARSLCRILDSTGHGSPVLLVTTEGGLAAVSPEWSVDDVVLAGAGPAEVDARIRLTMGRADSASPSSSTTVDTSGITIDETSYSAKVRGKPLDLTFKEFQLLHFLASNPSRVFSREQLLSEVWGYDYFGGTRTVDVHVRRLRAKLGDHDHLIGTVRNVGYRFNAAEEPGAAPAR